MGARAAGLRLVWPLGGIASWKSLPALHLSGASQAPPISSPRRGRALHPSVCPSLPSSPNVRIPEGNGAGVPELSVALAPSGPHCRGRGRFTTREGKGDRRAVLAWGQEPRRVTSPKPGLADPQALTADPQALTAAPATPALDSARDKDIGDPVRPGRAPYSDRGGLLEYARTRPDPPVLRARRQR